MLRDLLPGGAPPQLSADQAAALLRTVRPAGDVEKVRKDLARDLVTEIRALDKRLAENAARMEELVASSGSTLMNTPGVGPVPAAHPERASPEGQQEPHEPTNPASYGTLRAANPTALPYGQYKSGTSHPA